MRVMKKMKLIVEMINKNKYHRRPILPSFRFTRENLGSSVKFVRTALEMLRRLRAVGSQMFVERV